MTPYANKVIDVASGHASFIHRPKTKTGTPVQTNDKFHRIRYNTQKQRIHFKGMYTLNSFLSIYLLIFD